MTENERLQFFFRPANKTIVRELNQSGYYFGLYNGKSFQH